MKTSIGRSFLSPIFFRLIISLLLVGGSTLTYSYLPVVRSSALLFTVSELVVFFAVVGLVRGYKPWPMDDRVASDSTNQAVSVALEPDLPTKRSKRLMDIGLSLLILLLFLPLPVGGCE